MPHSAAAALGASFLGQTYNEDFSVESDMAIPFSPDVAPAKAGTITARTDNDTASATLATGHGITTGQIADIYWLDPTTGDYMHRHNMTVGSVSGNVVPLDGGTGDNLPVLTTVVWVTVHHLEDCVVTGDNIEAILLRADSYHCTFIFLDDAAAVLLAVNLLPNTSYVWTSALGTTNPLAGVDVASVSFTHASPDNTVNMIGAVGYN